MKTSVLCILDGFGLNPRQDGNAVAAASKPNFETLWATCPHTTLTTFGERVGLPPGQMGNSEVGHLNIGAGRVVEQWLLRISNALKGSFLKDSAEYQAWQQNLAVDGAIHLLGLYSDGGVHSHCEHLHLLIQRLVQDFPGKIYLHLITDGRDTSPNQAGEKFPELLKFLTSYPNVKIATIIGRFYAMDRDKRWERIQKAYELIVGGQGEKISDPVAYAKASYAQKITDEFLEPAVLSSAKIGPKDSLICWNFREDRMREIVRALAVNDFDGFVRPAPPFESKRALCFTDYDHTFHLPFLFSALEIKNHLGEYLANLGKHQLRVAETEKYAHVTYFFDGGHETPCAGEERALIPSPRDVRTYDLKPEMSAMQVMDAVIKGINDDRFDLIVVNFANCDMVGHTGNIPAAIRAVETVDSCLGEIIAVLKNKHGQAIIIADHGNADQMIHYEDGSPHTAHTTHPVPMIAFGNSAVTKLADGGALCDVAPTLLKMMGLTQPSEMTGRSLA